MSHLNTDSQLRQAISASRPGLWFGLFACISASIALAEAEPSTPVELGTALAQKVYDRPTGDDSSSKVLMSLQSKNGSLRKRVLYSYAKDKGNAERWTLLRFIEPNDVDGTGLLTLDHKGDDSDQWLYLPALDRVRRIASSRKGGRFVGSDFFYEDMKDREVDMDNHRFLGEAKLGKIDCLLLESTPVDKSNSVYSKRLSWIHPKLLLPLRIEFYQKGHEKPVKRLQASKIKKVQGYWTIFDSTMYDLKSGHKTKLLTTAITYDQNLPDALFTRRGLADDSKEQVFRPDNKDITN